MREFFTILWLLTIILFSFSPKDSQSQPYLDLETGLAVSGYNDVRIPGNTGTRISFTEELETDPVLFLRIRLMYTINDRHGLGLLVAPLRLRADGHVDRFIVFEGVTFPANTPLKAVYRFDSYRLTYRYEFYRSQKFRASAGVTAKIRGASIRLEGDGLKSEKKNTGFVPLLSFRGQWLLTKQYSLVLDGDALAAPQGRAEDIFFAMQYELSPKIVTKLGYRILEGGADNDEVYNFTMVHYAVLGAMVAW